jgi:hypothetical protein
MKIIVFIALFAVIFYTTPGWGSTVRASHSYTSANLSAATGESIKPALKKKRIPAAPLADGSKVILLKNRMKLEIRKDKTVWWLGANGKKAIMADGTHEVQDGQKIRTKGGRLVGKMPRIDPALQPQNSAQ